MARTCIRWQICRGKKIWYSFYHIVVIDCLVFRICFYYYSTDLWFKLSPLILPYIQSVSIHLAIHCAKKPVTTMLTYPWKCTVLHCNHLGNTWKPLVLMTRHFDYCPNASEGDNQSVRSSAPVVSRCFPGGYNVKLYISRGRLAWWLLAFWGCVVLQFASMPHIQSVSICYTCYAYFC